MRLLACSQYAASFLLLASIGPEGAIGFALIARRVHRLAVDGIPVAIAAVQQRIAVTGCIIALARLRFTSVFAKIIAVGRFQLDFVRFSIIAHRTDGTDLHFVVIDRIRAAFRIGFARFFTGFVVIRQAPGHAFVVLKRDAFRCLVLTAVNGQDFAFLAGIPPTGTRYQMMTVTIASERSIAGIPRNERFVDDNFCRWGR